MKFIESKCKICGGKAVARFEDDALPEAVDKFLPLLTCDRCYDLRDRKVTAEDFIRFACFRYHHSDKKGKIVSEIRDILLAATKDYAEALQGIHHAPAVIWSEQFVDTLIQFPDKCWKILRDYRDEVRRAAANTKEA